MSDSTGDLVTDIVHHTLDRVRTVVKDGIENLDIMGHPGAKLFLFTEVAALILASATTYIEFYNKRATDPDAQLGGIESVTPDMLHAVSFIAVFTVLREVEPPDADGRYDVVGRASAAYEKFTGKPFPAEA